MILILTINPLLEYRYSINNFIHPGNFRNTPLQLAAGGKGINISRQLKKLSAESRDYYFAGGFAGKMFSEILDNEGLRANFVKTKSDTRTASVIIDNYNKKVTTIFSVNADISNSEKNEYLSKLEKMIQTCEILVCSGSSPCDNCNSIFPLALSIANKYGKTSVLDTYGHHLPDCLNAKPTIVHLNQQEVTESLTPDINSETAMQTFLLDLYNKGIKQAFITNGNKPFYASNFDFIFKIFPPIVDEFDGTGSGDAFTAGIIYGHYKDYTFEQSVRLACGLGALNATRSSVCSGTAEESEKYSKGVSIEAVGKKMKLIDVTPTI